MKKFLRSFCIVSFLLVSLCLIMMLTTKAVYWFNTATEDTASFYGQDVMYAYSWVKYGWNTSAVVREEPSASAVRSFICLGMASIILGVAALIPMIRKERSFAIFSGILGLVSMVLIIVAAISVLCVPEDWSYFTEGGWSKSVEFHLADGYSAVSIISFIAAPLCLPSIVACFMKDKQEKAQD